MCSSCCLIALHIFTSGVSVWFMVTLLLKANGGVYLLKCALPMLSTPSFRVFCWIATFQTRTPNRPSHSCTVYVRQVRPGSTLVIEKSLKVEGYKKVSVSFFSFNELSKYKKYGKVFTYLQPVPPPPPLHPNPLPPQTRRL